ncbi:MAG: adenylate/guanylate cyclase domain-containing protein [Alphaproteobacteria bacterium]|nr:adenylate/guanylate cyclase domain-containing protein [Alphaproteobacteria bacterium]MBU0802696.1 adenylate/guanylate cyclase domain-containing protein [Alphaproteobacteria bacterium]MBU0871493.1 adenylate/guanylate cyclase domain-containing protein [Alphaproteobacteria bacterium]MBU1400160.1 adenylate/guanylate cyclase domain-containing protein [Alphaproteobacteria bacterium]MBU1591280.1 adenylate/guanylate cyclase domain-containing protein [Alphaproteobacteria bacterium]
MTAKKIKRKLTTIFCADVQSYSALMARDEADTLERLRRYRGIMNDLFERHEGRKVNTWGDAVIAEFPSVVEAVRCGVEIQDAIGAENRDLPQPKQMWFRIGINLGDVMEDGSDLYGDGVNVAARLESLADAGGIMVSETVYNLTNKHLALGYEFAGEQAVKGLDAPIAGYRVRMPGRNAEATDTAEAPSASNRPSPEAPPREADRDEFRFLDRWGDRISRFRAWYTQQPRKTRVPVAAIGIMAGINLLTTGLSDIWFVYPSIPLAAYLLFQHLTAPSKRA